MNKRYLLNTGIFILLLLICIPVVLPYFMTGYFPTHDGEWAVVRLADMFRTLRDFQIPPRFSGALNYGFGYPLFNFAYPFPYYLGVILYFPLQSFVLSVKSIFVISVILSSIFMYLASLKLWNNRTSALVSSIIYIYFPYRMLDLYVRGSIGESLSFALFPLILYLSLKLFESPYSRLTVCLLSLSIAILVLTHNIMTVLFIPLLLIFVISRIAGDKRFEVFQSFTLSIFLGACLSCFFWLPALIEKGNIALSIMPIADRNLYFVSLQQLIIPSWGYSPPTENGGFSYQLGIGQIITILCSIILLIFSFIKTKFIQTPTKNYAFILIIVYFIYFIFMFSFTGFIWNLVPLLSEINYPWTILSQLGFITALLAGFLVLQGRNFKYLAFAICIISIVFTYNYAKPQSTSNYSDAYYLTNEATTTSSSELMPLWVKERPLERYNEKVEVIKGNAIISNLISNSKSLKFNYKTADEVKFEINTIFYPGWKAYINGKETKINYDNPQGTIRIDATPQGNTIDLVFTETLPRTLANTVSVLGLLILIFILLRPLLLFRS